MWKKNILLTTSAHSTQFGLFCKDLIFGQQCAVWILQQPGILSAEHLFLQPPLNSALSCVKSCERSLLVFSSETVWWQILNCMDFWRRRLPSYPLVKWKREPHGTQRGNSSQFTVWNVDNRGDLKTSERRFQPESKPPKYRSENSRVQIQI